MERNDNLMKREILIKPKQNEFTYYAQKPLVADDVQAYEIVLDTPYDLANAAFAVSAKRADGAVITGGGTCSGRTARATLYSNMYNVAGETVLRLTLSQNGSVLTECEVVCTVVEGNGNADAGGDDRVPILTSLIAQTTQLAQQAGTAAAVAGEAAAQSTAAVQACEEAAARVPQDPISGEAPLDGKAYTRKNAAWSQLTKAELELEHLTVTAGSIAAGSGADAQYGGQVAIGQNSYSESGGIAIGGGAVAQSNNGTVVGAEAITLYGGTAIGHQARAGTGVAIGGGASAFEGFAAGTNAKAGISTSPSDGIDCIQLGTGTNNTAKTLQVYGYQLMDASGKLPKERLPQLTNADVGLGNVSAPAEGYVQIGQDASADTEYGAVAVGGAQAYDGSVAIGSGAQAWSGGAAVGAGASADNGGAVGSGASAELGGAVGWNASTTYGGAVGYQASSTYGFAGGSGAKANAIDCIQLGTGTNNAPETLQVYEYQLMDADGYIPPDRITDVGIWTPKIVSSTASAPTITYNRQAGDWIRIGNMVWCNFTIWMSSFTVGSANGSIVLGGLPFTPYGGLGRIVDGVTYTAYLNAASDVTSYDFLQTETNGIALIKRKTDGSRIYCKYASDGSIFNGNTEFSGIVCFRI